MAIDPKVWHDYDPETGIGDPSTPLSAGYLAQVFAAQDTKNSVTYAASAMLISAGIDLTGATDSTAAVQSLLNSAATFGLPVVLAPLSTVRVDALTVPSGTRLNLNGSTLKKTATSGAAMLTATGASNVTIENGIIDGDKASWAAATEWRHGISILGSSHVTLRDLTVKSHKGDGIYVGVSGPVVSSDVVLDRVTCDLNHRNGMSVVGVSGLEATNCLFTNTTGTNPQAGVDIEPNSGTVVCADIKFTTCVFGGNGHFGFLVAFAYTATVRQGGIELIGCNVTGNGVAPDAFGGGVNVRHADDFTMTAGTIYLNTGPGILNDWSDISTNVKFVGVNVETNTSHGLYVTQVVNGLSVIGCTFRGNGTAAAATYDGINLSPPAAMSSVRLIGNRSYGVTQRYGLLTSSTVSSLVSVANDYSGNGTGSTSLSDDAATRTQADGGSGNYQSTRHFYYSTAAANALSLRLIGDTNDRFGALTDGRLMWSAGSGSLDVQLSRVAAGVIGVGVTQAIRTGVAATASRPAAAMVGVGSQFYDSTLGKPIWSTGSAWKDAAGTVV